MREKLCKNESCDNVTKISFLKQMEKNVNFLTVCFSIRDSNCVKFPRNFVATNIYFLRVALTGGDRNFRRTRHKAFGLLKTAETRGSF